MNKYTEIAIKEYEQELAELKEFGEHEGHPNKHVMMAVSLRCSQLEKHIEELKQPRKNIHQFFGLSYAQYLVIPRSVLQSMHLYWQDNFVKLLDQLYETGWTKGLPEKTMYKVEVREYGYEHLENEDSEIEETFVWKDEITDPLADYRRGNRNVFDELKS
ncbi:hypothetical protein Q7A53_05620 [Halobacillus rhizosphaerae]|uniref:hypothetical protein n=1 Tax=Halobacillus rhizosphaerae TaxID=3064889 RepID=UPI00398AB05E